MSSLYSVLRSMEEKQDGQNMPLQMPHVSVCDSHNELPQSKHCVLAVLEQGKPTTSAEFLISTTSQCAGIDTTSHLIKWPGLPKLRFPPLLIFFAYFTLLSRKPWTLPSLLAYRPTMSPSGLIPFASVNRAPGMSIDSKLPLRSRNPCMFPSASR